MKHIEDTRFIIISNGYADGPSQALRDFLNKHSAKRVTMIIHPLVKENKGRHEIWVYERGALIKKTSRSLPHLPPLTYIFDMFFPLFLPKHDVLFGFNNLAAMRGLILRLFARIDIVVYWAVDFVSDRFGRRSVFTKVYNWTDKQVVKRVDNRIELSKIGVQERNKYLGVNSENIAPVQVVPMGSWNEDTPKISVKSWRQKKLVFLGHLIERQGVHILLEAFSQALKKRPDLKLEIIGGGPLLEDLKTMSKNLKIDNNTIFHGFVKSHKEVEKLLSQATVAVAAYTKDNNNFVQFTDAGKLKAYMGAGLPMIITDLPNNASELERAGVAVVIEQGVDALSTAIEGVFADRNTWLEAHRSSLIMARTFDWELLLSEALKNISVE